MEILKPCVLFHFTFIYVFIYTLSVLYIGFSVGMKYFYFIFMIIIQFSNLNQHRLITVNEHIVIGKEKTKKKKWDR